MSFKTILAVTQAKPEGDAMLEPAMALAEAHDAHLVLLAISALPALDYGYSGIAGSQLILQQMNQVHDEGAAAAKRLAERLQRAAGSTEVRHAEHSYPGLAGEVARQGRYADLILIGRTSTDAGQRYLLEKALEGALFESGRPVAVIPDGWKGAFGRRIMIGWDGSREAARAISAATPLIAKADEVTVALAAPRVGDDMHGEEPGADLGTVLARHSENVTVDRLPALGRSVTESILAHARDCNSDLLVLGGYGHSRFTEAVFGGVTRDMLSKAEIPLLLAH